jgi:hypothetical protein
VAKRVTDAEGPGRSVAWPEGMTGLWTGHIVKSTAPLTPAEKLCGMFFMMPGRVLLDPVSALHMGVRCSL